MDAARCRNAFDEAEKSGGRCDMRYQELDSDDALVIAEELAQNTTVTSLNLWKNSIAIAGAKAIAAAMTSNAMLSHLDVEGNGIGDMGARAFARGLQGNHTLTALNLAKNNITDVGAKALTAALQRNHSLLDLDISKNTQVSLEMKQAIRSALKTNSLRTKAMSALKELATLAATDPQCLAAVRALAAGEGVSERGMQALEELAQDAGMPTAATQAMHALAEAQKQAAIARAKAEQSVTEAQPASANSSGNSASSEWVAQVDPTSGKTYYWNTRTAKTTWKMPSGFADVDGNANLDDDQSEPGESDEDPSSSSSSSSSSISDDDSDDGLGASEDIASNLSGQLKSASGDDIQRSLQEAMEAGSIAEKAIEHDRSGDVLEAIACYKHAGDLLCQAAQYSQQSEHFQTKAAEYSSRASVLQASLDSVATEQRPVKLSKTVIVQATKQMESDPMCASVDDVCGWLTSLELSLYVRNFREQLIDGPMLAELTDEQMRADLGVQKMGERGKIRRARDLIFGHRTDAVRSTGTDDSDGKATLGTQQMPVTVHGELGAGKRKSNSSSSGERVKVQVRLGHDGEWINLKIPRSDLCVEALRPRLASALQVHEHALGHLQYRDKSGEWFAALEDDDIFDGIADLGGRYLILQAIGSGSPDAAGGAPSTETLKALVSPFQTVANGSGSGSAREKAAAKAKQLIHGTDVSAGSQQMAPSALAEARENRPERPEQIQTRLQRLMEQGQIEGAVEVLAGWAPGRTAMMETPTAPYNALLKLSNDKRMDSGISAALVQLMASRGIEPDKAAYTHFLRSLIRDQDLDFAVRVLGKMHDEGFPAGAATYGGIMDAYVGEAELMKAVQLGSKALAADAAPTLGVLNRLLVACAEAAAKDAGIATFKLMQASGWSPDSEAFTSLVQCAVGSADLALAMKVIEQMVATVETIQSEPFLSILGLCQAQEAKVEAVRIFQLMQAEGLEPNATAYSALLDCARATGDLHLCMSVVEQMMVAGLAPGVLAFNQMLAMAAEQKAKDAAVKIYELAVHKGSIQPDENSFGAMINCAWVCGDISLAIQYLKAMVAAGFEPSVAAINALLGACTRSSDALDIVKTVQASATSLDSASFTELLRCACTERNIELASRVLKQASRSAIVVSESALALLIDTACGTDISEAMQLLQLLMASRTPPSTGLINQFIELCGTHAIDGNMLLRVEALLDSLADAGSSVNLATQQAFKDLRSKTLRHEREAFVAKATGGAQMVPDHRSGPASLVRL